MPQASDWDSYFGSAAPAGAPSAPAVTGAAAGAAATDGQPAPASDQWESWFREPAFIASNVLKGVASMPRIPGMMRNALYRGLDVLTGSNVADTVNQNDLMSRVTNAPLQATTALGLTDNPHLAPQGLGENLLAGAATALPYAAADIISGGAAIPATISAMGSGMAAEYAHELAPDSTWAPIVAGALTGHVLGKGASSLAVSRAAKQADAAANEAAEQYALLRKNAPTTKKALDDEFAAGKSSADATHQATMLDIAQNHDATMLGHQTTLDNTAASLAPSETLEEAGQALQPAARKWIAETMPKKISDAWAPVDLALPGETPAPMMNFTAALNSINKKAGPAVQGMIDSMTPPLAKTLKTQLEAPAKLAEVAGTPPPPPSTWSDLAALRTTLGDKLADPKLLGDIGQQNAKTLYAALTADMRAAAGKADAPFAAEVASGSRPSTVSLFDQANATSKSLFDTAERSFGKVVTGKAPDATDPAPGAAASSILRAAQKDGTVLADFRNEVPEATDHLAAVAIRTGQWPKLADSAKEALIPDPAARAAVDAAHQGKAASIEETKAAVAAAKADYQDNLDALRTVDKQKRFEMQQKSADLQYTAAQARAKAARLRAGPPPNALMHGVGSLVGGELGGEVATVLGDTMGLPGSDLYHGAVGKIAGLTIPWTVRRAAGVVSSLYRNPAVRKSTAIGAAVGSTYAPVGQPQSLATGNALGAQAQ